MMSIHRNLTTVCCAAVLALGLAACGSSSDDDSAMMPTMPVDPVDPVDPDPTPDEIAVAKMRAEGLAAAIDAAKATVPDGDDGAGTFTDPMMVVPDVMATHDGTMATIMVPEISVSPARTGMFAKSDTGPASISGWSGAKFTRGTATEHVTVYTNIAAPMPAAFTNENLDTLLENGKRCGVPTFLSIR